MNSGFNGVAEEGAMLCEGCGYLLTGLPEGACCPECSKPMEESRGGLRGRPAWERAAEGSAGRRFVRTTIEVLFRPTRFFRGLATRVEGRPSLKFARIHRRLAAVLLGTAAFLQMQWAGTISWQGPATWIPQSIGLALLWACVALCDGFLALTAFAAGRLTAWEAGYRGFRLPRRAAERVLDYHTVHYLPVALVGLGTVAGYQLLLRWGLLGELSAVRYLWILTAEVIFSAVYLFYTYWVGMRNILFANA